MLAEFHDRLKLQLPPERWPGGVDVAEDIDALTARAGLVDECTAIVMPWKERAQPPVAMTGGFRQQVEEDIAVGIVIRIYDDMMGGDRALQFQALRRDVETALAGWVPPGAMAECSLVGGESSPITTGVSIYVQTWTFRRFLTGVYS